MTNTEKFEKLLDIIDYGLEFQRDFKDDEIGLSYTLGTVEGTAHIASCCIVQWFNTDGIGAGDVSSYLKLEDFPTRKKIEKRLKKLLKEMGVFIKN